MQQKFEKQNKDTVIQNSLDLQEIISSLVTKEEFESLNQLVDLLVNYLEENRANPYLCLGSRVDIDGKKIKVFENFDKHISVFYVRFLKDLNKLKPKEMFRKYDTLFSVLIELLSSFEEEKVGNDLKKYFLHLFLHRFYSLIVGDFLDKYVDNTGASFKVGPLAQKPFFKISKTLISSNRGTKIKSVENVMNHHINVFFEKLPEVEIDMEWQEIFDFFGIFKLFEPITINIGSTSKIIITPSCDDNPNFLNLSTLCLVDYYLGDKVISMNFDYLSMSFCLGKKLPLNFEGGANFDYGVKLIKFILWNILKQTDPGKENYEEKVEKVEGGNILQNVEKEVGEKEGIPGDDEQATDKNNRKSKVTIKLRGHKGFEVLAKLRKLTSSEPRIRGSHYNFTMIVDGIEKHATIPLRYSEDVNGIYVKKALQSFGFSAEDFKNA